MKKSFSKKLFSTLSVAFLALTLIIAAFSDYKTAYAANKPYTTYALFGVDNRSNGHYETGNSDCIMIVSINNTTSEVKVVSVLRDTYLNVTSGNTYRKSNYAYNNGGASSAVAMLERNLDLDIDGYVAVDFYALAKVVDDVGGIEVEITNAMVKAKSPSTGLPSLASYIAEVQEVIGCTNPNEWYLEPGVQTLNGSQIVGYCRQRYCGGDDFARTQRQRDVVKKIVNKIQTADAKTISKIVNDVVPAVSTDLSSSTILSIAANAKNYKITAASGFPFALTTGTYGDKGSLIVPCTLETNAKEMHKFLYNDTNYTPSAKVKSISKKIQNDTNTTAKSSTRKQGND